MKHVKSKIYIRLATVAAVITIVYVATLLLLPASSSTAELTLLAATTDSTPPKPVAEPALPESGAVDDAQCLPVEEVEVTQDASEPELELAEEEDATTLEAQVQTPPEPPTPVKKSRKSNRRAPAVPRSSAAGSWWQLGEAPTAGFDERPEPLAFDKLESLELEGWK